MVPGWKAAFPTHVWRDLPWASNSNDLSAKGWNVIFSLFCGDIRSEDRSQASGPGWILRKRRQGSFSCSLTALPCHDACSDQLRGFFTSAWAKHPTSWWNNIWGENRWRESCSPSAHSGIWHPARAVCSTQLQRWTEEINDAQAGWEGSNWLHSCEVIAFVNRISLLLSILRWSRLV